MALSNENIELARREIGYFRSGNENYATMRDRLYELFQSDPNYEAWIVGTEFGSKFQEKINELKSISSKLQNQGMNLCEKVENFLSSQERINKEGK